MTYMPADDRYDRMQYRRSRPERPEAAADLARPLVELRRRRPARDAAARSSAARSTSGSRTSTSPTTTGRRTARRRRTSASCSATTSARTATSSSSRPRPATTCGRGPTANGARASTCSPSLDQWLRPHGARLRRHLLLAPRRPRHAARGDDGRARQRRPPGQGAVRRHLVLLARADARGCARSCASSGRRCSSTSRRTRC